MALALPQNQWSRNKWGSSSLNLRAGPGMNITCPFTLSMACACTLIASLPYTFQRPRTKLYMMKWSKKFYITNLPTDVEVANTYSTVGPVTLSIPESDVLFLCKITEHFRNITVHQVSRRARETEICAANET